jgi:hypothetical protein
VGAMLSSVLPGRDATDDHLAERGRQIDITCDVDLGELVKGHHVVVRGIELAKPTTGAAAAGEREPQLHYEFVPGIEAHERDSDRFFWYWMLRVTDDVGTRYRDDNSGVMAPFVGGAATHGARDLGPPIPATASRLVFRFTPPSRFEPPGHYRSELVFDLLAGRVLEPS